MDRLLNSGNLENLCEVLGHADRNAGRMGYCLGLMVPIERNCVEHLAARMNPLHVRTKYQSLGRSNLKMQCSQSSAIGYGPLWW